MRVNERNAFRTALINYQRRRRTLQTAEDNLKIQLRNDLRTVHSAYINYEIDKRNYELNVRLKDQAFEQIVAPPAGGTQALAQSANAATQTTNLLNFQGRRDPGDARFDQWLAGLPDEPPDRLSRHRHLALRRMGGFQ